MSPQTALIRRLLAAILATLALSLPGATSPVATAWTSAIDGVTHGVASGTLGGDVGRAIAIGDDGSIYLVGFMQSDTVTIGSEAVDRVGDFDGLIARLTPDGNPVWFTSIGASGEETYFYDVEVFHHGTVVVAGRFTGTMTIGSDTITSAGGYDGFVGAFDTSGNGLWATRMGGGADDEVNDILVTAEGTIAAVGAAEGDVTAGSSNSTSPWNDTDDPDGIVFILDPHGDVVANSTRRIGSSGSDDLRNVASDSAGNLIVTGLVGPSARTPPHDQNEVSASLGGTDAFVASLDSSGHIVWSEVIGGAGDDVGEGVVVDSQGRITVAAQGRAPFTVDVLTYTGGDPSRNDIVLSQFNANGTVRWTHVVDGGTSTNDDGVRHLALGPEDELVTAGLLTPPGASRYRFMAMVHDADGNLTWGPATLGDDANRHIAQFVAVTTAGDLLLTGRFQGGPVNPDDPSVTLSTSSGTSDIVLIRLAAIVQTDQAITFSAPNDRSYSSTPFDIDVTTDAEGLVVAVNSLTTDVCTVDGLEVTTVDTGTCTLTASQAGELHYRPAAPITHSFTVTPASQTITFPEPDDRDLASSPIALAPTTDATGLSVMLTSATTDVCTVDGLDVTIVAPGTCTITASQPGDSRYAAATPVTRSFTITAPETTTSAPTTTTPTTTTPTTTTPTTTTPEPVEILPSTGFAPDGSTLPLLLGALGALVALVSRRRA